MDYLIIGLSSLCAAGLTLFSGFGLGTLLLPVFALFFDLPSAVAMTAIVHFLNNLFKLALVGKFAHKEILLRFGVPAVLAAFVGAWLLLWLDTHQALFEYALAGHLCTVTPVKLVIAALMLLFVVLELRPEGGAMPRKYLPLGGLMSGFFGGLSGHQGAMRSAFLVQCGLSPHVFVGTGVAIACLVDSTRIAVYGMHHAQTIRGESVALLAVAVVAAFAGAFIGSRLLGKVTIVLIRRLVAGLLFLVAVLLGSGII